MADWNTTGEVEVWKAVPGFDYYEASSLGRVKSLERVVVASGNRWGQVMRRRMRERIMKLKTSKRGYQSVALWRNGKTRIDKRLSRLILETFVGSCPDGMEACHENGVRDDDRLSNLRWDTHANNEQDKHGHGTYQWGEQAPTVKLTEREVLEIRSQPSERLDVLARAYGVCAGTIKAIRGRRLWKHI